MEEAKCMEAFPLARHSGDDVEVWVAMKGFYVNLVCHQSGSPCRRQFSQSQPSCPLLQTWQIPFGALLAVRGRFSTLEPDLES